LPAFECFDAVSLQNRIGDFLESAAVILSA